MNIYNYNFIFKKIDKNNKNNLIVAITNNFNIKSNEKNILFYYYKDKKTFHKINSCDFIRFKDLNNYLLKSNLHILEKKTIKDEIINKYLIIKQIEKLQKDLNIYKQSI